MSKTAKAPKTKPATPTVVITANQGELGASPEQIAVLESLGIKDFVGSAKDAKAAIYKAQCANQDKKRAVDQEPATDGQVQVAKSLGLNLTGLNQGQARLLISSKQRSNRDDNQAASSAPISDGQKTQIERLTAKLEVSVEMPITASDATALIIELQSKAQAAKVSAATSEGQARTIANLNQSLGTDFEVPTEAVMARGVIRNLNEMASSRKAAA
jgi:hypothetical protein